MCRQCCSARRMGARRWRCGAGRHTRGHRTAAGDDDRRGAADATVPSRVARHAGRRRERLDCARAGIHRAVHREVTAGAVADLAPSFRVVALAIREPPFAELPERVATVWQSYQLQCAADGMLYQLAWCRAARELGLEVHLCRRGDEAGRAAARLHLGTDMVEAFVNGIGRPSGPPWTEEHRRAFAAGIAVLACDAALQLASSTA